jgi:hypothetical protein
VSLRLQVPLDAIGASQLANLRWQAYAVTFPAGVATWTAVGSAAATGFGDVGGGSYVWEGSAADAFDGVIVFTNISTGATYGARNASQYKYDGPAPVNLVQVAGMTATAAAPVAFPAAVGTSTYSGGAVSTVTDKAGYALSATGLDAVGSAPQIGAPTTLVGKLMWLAYRMGLGTVIKDTAAGTIVTKAGASTVMTTNTFTSTSTVDTVNPAS